ncbi:MAG: response regulator [Calditrichaeota bacterium]|nr:response regulator [Calditrichota bacterium]
MNKKILFVDDEENVLSSFKRNLRREFSITTAPGGHEGLEIIKNQGPFAVVVSDMQMPKMKGSEFLAEVKKISPDSSRILLTGYANIENAIDAVNHGSIFRFLTKPCSNEALISALHEAIRQNQLLTGEKELLEKTLKNSINVLTEILGMVNPAAFGRANRVKRYVNQIARLLKLNNIWKLDMAAMLSQIGFVTLPNHILEKVYHQEELSAKERNMLAEHPEIGAQLIKQIPRLEDVSQIIRNQNTDFSEHQKISTPLAPVQKFIVLSSQILKVVLGFDEMIFRGISKPSAMSILKRDKSKYNPKVVDLLEHVQISEKERMQKTLALAQLKSNMLTNQNIISLQGKMLVAKDTELTDPLIQRLKSYDVSVGVQQPIKIFV